jgi:predicted Zn-dependent peptidase
MLDELKRSCDDMTEVEVARARAQLKAGLLMGLESPSSRAERAARLLAIWGRVPDLDETVAKIDAVSLKDVRSYAGALTQARSALALYGPVAGAPGLDAIRKGLAA